MNSRQNGLIKSHGICLLAETFALDGTVLPSISWRKLGNMSAQQKRAEGLEATRIVLNPQTPGKTSFSYSTVVNYDCVLRNQLTDGSPHFLVQFRKRIFSSHSQGRFLCPLPFPPPPLPVCSIQVVRCGHRVLFCLLLAWRYLVVLFGLCSKLRSPRPQQCGGCNFFCIYGEMQCWRVNPIVARASSPPARFRH